VTAAPKINGRKPKRARSLFSKPKRARPLCPEPDVIKRAPPPDVEGLLQSVDRVNWAEVYTDMMKASICLFGRDILGLELGPHLILWGDLIHQHGRIATNAARDHSKSTFWSYAYPIWRVWMDPGQEVYLFSKTLEGACEFLDIIMYGRDNLKGMVDIPELAHLVPDPDAVRTDRRLKVTQSDVKFTNGSRIRAMGWGKATRGRHPKYIVCDDVLNDEDMWSETVRRKNIEYFKSAISQMVPPGGQLIVVGTPFHMADLYGWLRKNKRYKWVVFPGIIKDPETGADRALFPWRYSLDQLYEKREEIGSVSFTREILCQPISDDISVFPQYLFPPLYDMTLKIRPSLDEIRSRGWTTYMGVDIARSANVGADYFVVFVIAKDREGNCYIVDIRRSKGLAFRRQLEEIAIAAQLYDPALIFIEANAMQQIYTAEMRRLTDLPVKEFVTTAQNKYPLDKGVPGLRIGLENKKVVIPRGDDLSVRITDVWISECTQFGFVDGKLQGIGEHDDCVMGWWFANEASLAGGFSFAFGDEDGDASDDWQDDGTEESWEDVMLGGRDELDGDTAFGV
jgi:hypothetical protein